MKALARVRDGGLVLWGVGALTLEAIASVGMVLCATAALGEWVTRRRELDVRAWVKTWAPLLAFTGWMLTAPLLAARWPTSTGLARQLEWLGVPLAAYAFAQANEKARRALAWVAAVTLALSCLAALLQYLGAWPSAETFVGWEWTRIPFYRVYEPAPGVEGRFMGGGLSFHRLRFAHVGALAVLVALAVGLRARGRARFWALGLAVCGFLSVLLFPLARMASVALAVAAFFVVMLAVENRRRAFTAGVVGAVVLGAAAMAHAPLRARFLAADTSEGSGERGALLRAGLEAVSQHPLLGTGLGRFRPSHFVGEKAPSLVLEHTGKAHNQFVTIAAEGGVVALLLFVWVLAWLARRMDSRDPLGIAGLGALVLFGLLSLTHDPLFHASFSAGLTLVLGMAVARGSGAH